MIAVTRGVSGAIAACEVTFADRQPIDYQRAVEEHGQYVSALRALGCEIHELIADEAHPDCVFIEDTAIVLDELAIITRPGAETRRGETVAVASMLSQWRKLHFIQGPATIDGGDVLVLDRRIFIGLSTRTTAAAVEQVREITSQHGYQVEAVPVRGALHLKSAVTRVAKRKLLVNRKWVDEGAFAAYKRIEVDPSEPGAANALLIGDRAVFPAHYPLTRRRLEENGVNVIPVACSEISKAEGGVTCCSLLLNP